MLDVCIYTSQSLFSTVEHLFFKVFEKQNLTDITKIREVKKN